MYRSFIKRIIDFTLSLLGLIVISPLMLIIIIFLFFANKGKPFFFQNRLGKNGKPFKILKFKTMNDKKDENGKLLPDAKRITKVGSFIRKTSLDELPQFINILKGDMSIVGPRPLMLRYYDYYNDIEKRRFTVRPGIIGLASLNGRNNQSWHSKLTCDITYVNNLSFKLDCKIFFGAIIVVLGQKGVAKDGYATVDAFDDYCKKNPIRNYDL